MAQCKNCGRKGLFLSVNRIGVCSACSPLIRMQIEIAQKQINESVEIIRKSKKAETVISRYDFLIQVAERLLELEKKGINPFSMSSSQMIEEFKKGREKIVVAALRDELDSATKKVQVSTSATTKISLMTKVLYKIGEIRPSYPNNEEIIDFEREAKQVLHQIQLDDLLDEAKKAEFKGNKKKALDKFYDTLYFLKHDDIDDSLQSDMIVIVEKKIIELGGQLK